MARAMKNSGIEWIGQIPDDWSLVRIGSQYTERKTKVSDTEYAPLSVTMKGILPQLDTAAKTDAHDDRKLVCKGDFAINSRSDRRGSCGISPCDGSVSLINTILQPRDEMDPKYYDWLFHSTMFSDEFYRWGHGIVDDLWTTSWQDMKKITIPEPPLSAQRNIADFLDRRCAEIDSVIAETEKTVEEYKALKQSIITEAVTKGIRGTRQTKPSGMSWIGDIPAEWCIERVKHHFTNGKGLPITKENLIEEGLPVISYGQIHSKENNGVSTKPTLLRFVDYGYAETYPQCEVFQYDFVFADTSEDYAGCGNCVYKRDSSRLFAGYHAIALHSREAKDQRYMAYLFQSDCWRKQLREVASGVKLFSISQKTLMNAFVFVPSPEEQKEIADYLDRKCETIDRIIVDKEAQIAPLEAYKKSVIYEYVTGKKEVPTCQ